MLLRKNFTARLSAVAVVKVVNILQRRHNLSDLLTIDELTNVCAVSFVLLSVPPVSKPLIKLTGKMCASLPLTFPQMTRH